MKKIRTTMINSKARDRKLVELTKIEGGYEVTLETVKFGRSTFETLATGIDFGAAHFCYVQKILVLHSDGYLIELGGMAAYE